ncbi:MAG: glutaredoxin domain-containing protein [Planctomycetota bacterium]
MAIEIITRRLCGGCQELKRRLKETGIEYVEHDAETVDGLAAWAWYDAPALVPAVAIDGRLLPGVGDPDALFEAVITGAQETERANDER